MASYFSEHDVNDQEHEEQEIDFEEILRSALEQQQFQTGVPPVSTSTLRELPVLYVSKKTLQKLKEEGRDDCCGICFNEYELEDKCNELPCKHFFHSNCLQNWLKKHASCPFCRKELQTDDPFYEEKKLDKENKHRRKENINSMYM